MLTNAITGIDVREVGSETEVNSFQPNAKFPSDDTDSGILTEVKELYTKANVSIVVTDDGIVIAVKAFELNDW